MANRLSSETSPYLLQHAENPVDWYPWGEEALERARTTDRPILLSIGYSACHWCHVMEHESFSDPDVASIMNRDFVCIKVDREERPDIDSVYMTAVQAMTGAGGWPLTAFLKPDGVPYYGGTYFPPEPRHRLPSFRQVLDAASKAYRNRRDALDQAGDQLLNVLRGGRNNLSATGGAKADTAEILAGILGRAVETAGKTFDGTHGGFGAAPKFPQPVVLDFLLRQGGARSYPVGMVTQTLHAMAKGGLRDHLAGGFHRYSVDAVWLVPHFEKMLYDNALLSRAYALAHTVTGDPALRAVAEETIDYVLTDLRSPDGAFYSARDADSEGEEGRFYVWNMDEVEAVLGPTDSALFCRTYDVSAGGNFEGRNILHLPHDMEAIARAEGVPMEELVQRLAGARARLLERRGGRTEPMRDEKVIASWNGMMIRTLAEAGAALGRPDYVAAGVKGAETVLGTLFEDGRLLRISAGDRAHVLGFLEDYGSLGNACLSLYEATLDPKWLIWARTLTDAAVHHFWDTEAGRFYDTSPEHDALVVRPRDVMDNAVPSGHSLIVELLLRLGTALGDEERIALATRALASETELMARYPTAVARLLTAAGWVAREPVEVVVVGTPSETRDPLAVIHGTFLPERVIVGGDPMDEEVGSLNLLLGRTERGSSVYVCRANACLEPAVGIEEVRKRLATVAEATATDRR